MRAAILASACAAALCIMGAAATQVPIALPKPRMEGGKPLMQALKERKTSRSFDSRKLPLQTLSDLLWAANGVNRPAEGKRTAPSAMNWQEVDIYAALPDGLYRYDAKGNRLEAVLGEDLRPRAGEQPFVKTAPVVLIYVADYRGMGDVPAADKDFYAATDTGFVSQNVYLYCASEGLATVVLGWVDRPALAGAMKLRSDQKIILTQPVGYPK